MDKQTSIDLLIEKLTPFGKDFHSHYSKQFYRDIIQVAKNLYKAEMKESYNKGKDKIINQHSPINYRKKQLYDNLPVMFETDEGVKYAKKFKISERTFKTYLNDMCLFEKIHHGRYCKLQKKTRRNNG